MMRPLSMPPRKKISSTLRPQERREWITRLCAGAARGGTGGDDGGAQQRPVARVLRDALLFEFLDLRQAIEEGLERAGGVGKLTQAIFVRQEAAELFFAEDPFGTVVGEDTIKVEGQAQFCIDFGSGSPRVEDLPGGKAGGDGIPDIFGVGGEEEFGVEGRHVGEGIAAAAKGGAGQGQFVVFDRVEDAQPGVGGVTRQQDDIYRLELRCDGIEPEQPPTKAKAEPLGRISSSRSI